MHLTFTGLEAKAKEVHVAIGEELASREVLSILERELMLHSGSLGPRSLDVEFSVGDVSNELVSVNFYTRLYDYGEYLDGVSRRLMGYALARLRGYSQAYARECLVIPKDTPLQVRLIKDAYAFVNLQRLKQVSATVNKGPILDSVYELVDERSRVFRYYIQWKHSGDLVSVGELEIGKK